VDPWLAGLWNTYHIAEPSPCSAPCACLPALLHIRMPRRSADPPVVPRPACASGVRDGGWVLPAAATALPPAVAALARQLRLGLAQQARSLVRFVDPPVHVIHGAEVVAEREICGRLLGCSVSRQALPGGRCCKRAGCRRARCRGGCVALVWCAEHLQGAPSSARRTQVVAVGTISSSPHESLLLEAASPVPAAQGCALVMPAAQQCRGTRPLRRRCRCWPPTVSGLVPLDSEPSSSCAQKEPEQTGRALHCCEALPKRRVRARGAALPVAHLRVEAIIPR